MKHFFYLLLFVTAFNLFSIRVRAFCGFYVAKADSKLFNEASEVVLVRDEDKTVLTMVNDYKGEMKEFALVVPVPAVLEKEQIHIAEKKVVDRLDAFTAPRLVEYFDPDPCHPVYRKMRNELSESRSFSTGAPTDKSAAYGVKIEAQYTVGEYDILILSAKESGGLIRWLKNNNYQIQSNAEKVLQSYIRQNLKFFVAKVNLKEQLKTGYTFLRPIQIAYDSQRFMLPIRLGTVNAQGYQDLIVMSLTKKGRVETTNYRTVKIPSDDNLPPYVKSDFGSVYKALFSEQVKREDMNAVFLEYAWDMGWCDPCAAEPLSVSELKDLGVFWLSDNSDAKGDSALRNSANKIKPQASVYGGPGVIGPVNAYVTRLHIRYNEEKFPDDLMFQVTSNRENFQGRYVLQHPFTGDLTCDAGKRYKEELKIRQDKEAMTLAHLTGWDVNEIRKKMGKEPLSENEKKTKWWEKLWKNEK